MRWLTADLVFYRKHSPAWFHFMTAMARGFRRVFSTKGGSTSPWPTRENPRPCHNNIIMSYMESKMRSSQIWLYNKNVYNLYAHIFTYHLLGVKMYLNVIFVFFFLFFCPSTICLPAATLLRPTISMVVSGSTFRQTSKYVDFSYSIFNNSINNR